MDDASKERTRRKIERAKQRYAEDPEFREKAKAESRRYRVKNADAVNTRARVRRYGLSVPEYTAMVARQKGICVICLKLAERGLCIDHDHQTRKARDLLCGKCNLGLGNYNDDSAAMRRGADYLDYWKSRHAGPHNTEPSPFAAGSRHDLFAPSLPSIQSPPLTEEGMTPTDDTTEESKTSRMMRRAILHELLQPFDPDPPPPVDMLQAVSRAIVIKASQGDMIAAREVLDRIDGKTPAAAAPAAPKTPKELTPARETCS
jgi:hypothetical protein